MSQEQVQMVATQNSPQIDGSTTATPSSIIETTEKGKRANWSNRVVYLLSIIGFVVDLGKRF
jgi:hypothetical protein